MIVANLYGRLGQDPVERVTKSGAAMATASVAVDISGKDAEPQTLWVSVLGFGAASEALLRSSRGEMVSVIGRLSRGTFTGRDGSVRETWSMLADTVLTASSSRPTAGKRQHQGQDQQRHGENNHQDHIPFDDKLPF